jgi:hypothetical protein
MKKTLLTLALVAAASVSSFAQGTINPLNGALTRVKIDTDNDGVYESTDRNATAADGLTFSVYWGAAGSAAPENLLGTMTIGTTDGVMVGLSSILAVPNAGDAGTTISLQVRASNALGWRGQTDVKQVSLAPSAGPGSVVWGSSATAARFSPLLVTVPEPSTIALGVLGLGSLLLFRRRK